MRFKAENLFLEFRVQNLESRIQSPESRIQSLDRFYFIVCFANQKIVLETRCQRRETRDEKKHRP